VPLLKELKLDVTGPSIRAAGVVGALKGLLHALASLSLNDEALKETFFAGAKWSSLSPTSSIFIGS